MKSTRLAGGLCLGGNLVGLNEQQWKFSRMVADLIQEANHRGYEVALGEAERPAFTAAYYAAIGKGVRNSFHGKSLAIDLKLFRNGVYLTKTEDHRELGEWWEKQDPMCSWGGRFPKPDGNHYSYGEGK